MHPHLSSLLLFMSNMCQAYSKNSYYFLCLFLLSLSLKVIWLFLPFFFDCPLYLQHLCNAVNLIPTFCAEVVNASSHLKTIFEELVDRDHCCTTNIKNSEQESGSDSVSVSPDLALKMFMW